MKNVDILKIPANRIIALILLDIMSIVVAAFTALYIRFDFSFNGIPSEYLQKFERIIPYSIIFSFSKWHMIICPTEAQVVANTILSNSVALA